MKNANTVSQIGKIRKLPEFREVFFGSFEGDDINKTWAQIAKTAGIGYGTNVQKIINQLGLEKFREATKEADPRHLAEDAEALNNRMDQAVSQLAEETKGLGRVLIVSHGDFIKTLGIKYWDQTTHDHDIPFPDNGSVTRGIIDDNGKFVFTDEKQAWLLIKYLCYKIIKDDETKDLLEVGTVVKVEV